MFVFFFAPHPSEMLSEVALLLVFQDIWIWFQENSEWLENIEMKNEMLF